MRYSVHAFGIEYAKFLQERDALEYAKRNSEIYRAGWFEVLDRDEHYVAFKGGFPTGPSAHNFI